MTKDVLFRDVRDYIKRLELVRTEAQDWNKWAVRLKDEWANRGRPLANKTLCSCVVCLRRLIAILSAAGADGREQR